METKFRRLIELKLEIQNPLILKMAIKVSSLVEVRQENSNRAQKAKKKPFFELHKTNPNYPHHSRGDRILENVAYVQSATTPHGYLLPAEIAQLPWSCEKSVESWSCEEVGLWLSENGFLLITDLSAQADVAARVEEITKARGIDG